MTDDTTYAALGTLTGYFRLGDLIDARSRHTALCLHYQDHQCPCICGEFAKKRAEVVRARLCCASIDPCPVHR